MRCPEPLLCGGGLVDRRKIGAFPSLHLVPQSICWLPASSIDLCKVRGACQQHTDLLSLSFPPTLTPGAPMPLGPSLIGIGMLSELGQYPPYPVMPCPARYERRLLLPALRGPRWTLDPPSMLHYADSCRRFPASRLAAGARGGSANSLLEEMRTERFRP